jgi:hypothetical protein
MYHVIHATDHPEASPLMIEKSSELAGETQIDFDVLWLRINSDDD